MKNLLLSLLCAAGLSAAAQAQIFRPQIANDVLIGGVAGAIIGENNHHHAAEGALIGAAAGYLWGAATTSPSQPTYAPPVPVSSSYGLRTIISAPCGYGYATPAPTVVVYGSSIGYRHPVRRAFYGAPAPMYWGSHYHYSYRGRDRNPRWR
jgi:opacity protein-like surface antigen